MLIDFYEIRSFLQPVPLPPVGHDTESSLEALLHWYHFSDPELSS